MNTSKNNRPTPVVTVFLAASGKVALFKRSNRVGTYAGAWAGVSGYVERLPLEQAYLELEEEASLAKDDVELHGIGVPVPVEDAELGRSWLVFPFLFDRYGPQKIAIDWENESIEWVEPGELKNRPTVPGLERALASVWPPFGDMVFWSALAEIALDTSRGATALGLMGLEAVDSLLRRNPSASRERTARALAACRPSMGIFPHLAARFLLDQPREGELSRSIAEATIESATRAAKALASYNRVLTNSASMAVKETLVRRSKMQNPLHVIVMESRPGLEGIDLARELAREGVRVAVITDAQVNLFTSEVDAVIVGSDAVTAENDLQNKAGTSVLVMSARAREVPCFAVTQTCKIVPAGFPSVMEEQEPDKVGTADGVKFRNFVFDRTPLDSFEAIICESGPLTASTISSIRSRLGTAKLKG